MTFSLFRTVCIWLFITQLSTAFNPPLSCACPEISTSEASQQMQSLAHTIRYHNNLYYEKNQPEISDAEYDRLFASLIQLEGCFPGLITADTPTKKVGSGVVADGTGKVKHDQPMISLTSTTGSEAIEALLKRTAALGTVRMLVQPKVDGLPVELTYVTGRLVSAATRGDGRFGVDVTARVREIKGIPQRLSGRFPERVVVRGEVYADLSLLKKLETASVSDTSISLRHPRHIAAGVLQAHTPEQALLATLRLFPFELVTSDEANSAVRSDTVALLLLSQWGFPVDSAQTRVAHNFSDIQTLYRGYQATRNQQPFAMDGIVVKVDDLSLRQRLGEGERAPFWAAAWKFPPDTAQTRIRKIVWTVGRTGRRTPVAEVEPVRLGGVEVSRVSLHSDAEVTRLDIAPGDLVLVALVGDVIPQVVDVLERTPRGSQSGIIRTDGHKAVLDACLYDSPDCRNQFLAKATYFVSKSGLHVAGFGRGRMKKLIEAGLVTDLPSLFLLKTEDVATVPGFSLKAAQHLTAAMRGVGRVDSFRLVTALGIPGVGAKSVQQLARQFTTLDALLAAEEEVVTALSPRNARAAKTLRSFFQTPGGQGMLVKFREQGVL